MKRLSAVLLAVVIAVTVSACEKKKAKEKEAPPPPPPPTAEELSRKVEEQLGPLILAGSAGAPQMVSTLNSEFGKLRGEVNGEKAMLQVKNWLKGRLNEAMAAQQWDVSLALCDAIDAVEPGNSRTLRSRERATAERNRPVVTVKGFVDDDKTTTIFMDVYLPETGETQSIRMREGEEQLGLKVERIIGDNKGVRIKYLKTDQTFDVEGL